MTAADVASVPWYHTLDLGNGVVTPGEYDLRPALRRLPFPGSLVGKRCLDVGTHDGFRAFEKERRGADAVVGIDLADPASFDWPLPAPNLDPDTLQFLADRRAAFNVAKRALTSSVERLERSVYDLSPDDVGTFDFAVIGTLLLHLRDPIGALMALRRSLDSCSSTSRSRCR